MNDRRTEPQFDLGVTHEGDEVSSRTTFSDQVTEKLVQTAILTEDEMTDRSNKLSEPAEPKLLKAKMLIGAIIGIGFLASFGFPDTNTNREINAGSVAKSRPVSDAPDQFHCADYYYGSLPRLQEAVKERLRDPDSYEHIKSRFSGVRPDGTQDIIMDYRARNGFGGYSIERALGKLENSTCMLISWKIME